MLTSSNLNLKEFSYQNFCHHLDTSMVTETRHSCKNIRMVRGVTSPVEYSQNFSNVNKIIIEGFRNI